MATKKKTSPVIRTGIVRSKRSGKSAKIKRTKRLNAKPRAKLKRDGRDNRKPRRGPFV